MDGLLSVSDRIRRTQAQRRSQSERALLDAAVQLISREGVGAVTFEALGRTGGFSRGLASSRFGSKAKLIESLLLNLHERQEAMVAEQGFDSMPGLEAVLSYVDVCLRDMARRHEARAYFLLLSSSVAEATALRGAFAETHAVVQNRLDAWVRRGQTEGEIDADLESESAALMIGCLMFGMSMQLMVDLSVDFEALREASLSMLRKSLTNTAVVASA